MTLSTTFRKPAPCDCEECEFGFSFLHLNNVHMISCVINDTHHAPNQPLCAWYVRAPTLMLETHMRIDVADWLKAVEISELPTPLDHQAIRNIIQGRAGPKLSEPKGNHHEE